MADYKATKLFFESNQFLSQPLQISLIKQDTCGKLNEDEKSKLGIQCLQLKVELKQEKHPELSEQTLGRQLCFLHYLKKNKERLQQKRKWEDDSTRELKMKQDTEFQKRVKDKVQKQLQDGNVLLFSVLKEPTIKIEENQDSQPMLALEHSAPALALTMEAETYSEGETDVEEPPPCDVHLMYSSNNLLESDLILR